MLGYAIGELAGGSESAPLRILKARPASLEAAVGVTDPGMKACGGAAFSKHGQRRLTPVPFGAATLEQAKGILREEIAFLEKDLAALKAQRKQTPKDRLVDYQLGAGCISGSWGFRSR